MQIHEKFREIRKKLLNMSQTDLAKAFKATQKDISLLENGKKEFIPNRYLTYLVSENIDLNSLFNPKEKVYKRDFSSSSKSVRNFSSKKSSDQDHLGSFWIAREDDPSEKTARAHNSSDEVSLEKITEVLYGIRALLNDILREN